MIIEIDKDQFLERLILASHFTSDKLTTSIALQGVSVGIKEDSISLYTTNLNVYYQTRLAISGKGEAEFVIEPKRLIEFMQFLQPGKITLDIKDKQTTILQGKTKGNFPTMVVEDFPPPPKMPGKEQKIATSFLTQNLPLILFTASNDDARPVLTGISFSTDEDNLVMVATDGFRLSLVKERSKGIIPSMIVPAEFLQEVLRNINKEKEVGFSYSQEEKTICFYVREHSFYSRLIEGEFPPYERVLPAETKTTAILEKDDLMRNIKLISVFARDFSNVVVCDFRKNELAMRPKKEGNEENTTVQEAQIKGEEMRVAFNFRYLLDFLNHTDSKSITIEMLRPDAPVVFRNEKNNDFLHIIMPVRIQE